jgi:hypothetical protein
MTKTIFADVVTKVPITEDQIKCLLCDAFEGGSNYWCQIVGYKFPDGIVYKDFREGGRFGPKTSSDQTVWVDPALAYWHPHQLIPLHEGCALLIKDQDEDKDAHRLDPIALRRGLRIMAEKYPQHFANVVNDNDDAETGDVFLQCCLFGEIVYV